MAYRYGINMKAEQRKKIEAEVFPLLREYTLYQQKLERLKNKKYQWLGKQFEQIAKKYGCKDYIVWRVKELIEDDKWDDLHR